MRRVLVGKQTWRLAVAGAGILLVGCGGSDPNKPLTADEGAALLRDVRNNPRHVRELSPVEKAYLRERLAK